MSPTCAARRGIYRSGGQPKRWGLNFTLTTSLGDIDLLVELTGGGSFDDLIGDSDRIEIFGMECLCLGLERLIVVKRAAGRPKDLDAIAELEAIREEMEKG